MTREEIIAANPLPRFLTDRSCDLRPAGENFVTSACPVTTHRKHHCPNSIDVGRNLWHCNDCNRGGTVIDWVIIENSITAADAMRMLGGGKNGSSEIVATYDYTDEVGRLLFQCVRFEPKAFRQRQPDGKGGWVWNLEGTRRVLYRLPDLLRAIQRGWPVVVVEGEKDADCIAKHDLRAAVTCNPLGAGKWREDYTETLRGATVLVVADKDKAGREHAQQVAASLHGKAKRVSIVQLPDRDGYKIKDVTEWLAAGGTTSELAELLDAAAEWMPELKMSESELADVLDSISTFLSRYVVFQVPEQSQVIALWVTHCWVLGAFEYTPYLHVASPEKQCGKTRLLDCLELLTPKPWRAVLPSEAVLFRKIEKDRPTLLLDELDGVFTATKDDRKEALRSLLNAGFERKATIPRCVGQGPNQDTRDFAVFSPKALAGIGKLPDTVRDRAIPIQLVRRARDEKIERFRKREAQAEAEAIRTDLEQWSKQSAIIDKLRAARPSLPEALSDRQQDICEPLLAIADIAGCSWPERGRNALVNLYTAEGNDDDSLGAKLLSAIREIFDRANVDRIPTRELLDGLTNEESDGPWANWWEHDLKNENVKGPAARLARLLKPYAIKAKVIRLPDGTTPRGYMRNDFEDSWNRYCSAKLA